MNYKIAICDDSDIDRQYISNLVNRWAENKEYTVQVSLFPSAENFLFHCADQNDHDILLLDIEMGTMNGVTLAKRIRKENERVQIVFITGFPDYMAEGYEVAALHYLMKPVLEEKLHSVLDRATANIAKAEKQLCIIFERQTNYVPLNQIYYIEAQKQYVVIYTNDRTYRMKVTLTEIEKQLNEYFFKCQRSFIVNLRFVKRILQTGVVLKNDQEIPISRGMAARIGKEMIRLF